MILDDNLEFCDATPILLTAATTQLLGDVVDLGTVVRGIGNGRPVYLVLSINAAFTAGNTAQFKLASDAQAAIAIDGTSSDHWTSELITSATGLAGKTFVVPLPSGTAVPYERYLGILQINGATTDFTGGSIDAFLTFDPVGQVPFVADAVN